MTEGYIIINSESRLNQADTDLVRATYNLKHANLDLNKKYEISLVRSAFIVESTVSKEDAEEFMERLIIVESNLVKNNDYVSLTNDPDNNYSTRPILAVLNYANGTNLNAGAGFFSSVISDEPDISYQEMSVGNYSNITIVLKEDDGDDYTAATVNCTNYTFVFKYREKQK